MNFVAREKEVEEFWRENNIFRKSMENRKEGETYTFYDGPPTANGKPHIGHVLTRVIRGAKKHVSVSSHPCLHSAVFILNNHRDAPKPEAAIKKIPSFLLPLRAG